MNALVSRLKRFDQLLCAALLLAALAYLQAFRFEFIYDDFILIVDNPAIQQWSRVPHYFAGGMFDHLPGGQSFNFYRPLFLLWLRLNHAAFWLAAGYWHVALVVAHLAATYFVWKLTKAFSSNFVAGCGALLFALHPAHLEPVAWLSAGSEALFTATGLAALHAYGRYRNEGRTKELVVSCLLFAASLLFKETALVFIPLLIALDYCFSDRQQARLLKSVSTFAVVSIVYLAIRHAALGTFATVDHSRPLTKLLVTWPSLIWFYLGKLMWPFRLTYLHDVGFVDSATSIRFIFPMVAILVMLTGSFLGGRRDRRIWLASAIILIPILPPLLGTWVYNEYDLVHDRYLYLPVLGFCLLLAFALEHLRSNTLRNLALGSLTAAYFFTVLLQGWIYTNNLTVFSRATEVASNNPLGWELLGEEYMKLGDSGRAKSGFEAALARDPGFWLANFNLGRAYFESKDPASAEIYFKRAAKKDGYLDPGSRGRQYYYLGLSQFRQGKLADAEQSLRKALQESPHGLGYNFALGQILEAGGRFDEARAAYQAEMKSRNGAPDAEAALQRLNGLEKRK